MGTQAAVRTVSNPCRFPKGSVLLGFLAVWGAAGWGSIQLEREFRDSLLRFRGAKSPTTSGISENYFSLPRAGHMPVPCQHANIPQTVNGNARFWPSLMAK